MPAPDTVCSTVLKKSPLTSCRADTFPAHDVVRHANNRLVRDVKLIFLERITDLLLEVLRETTQRTIDRSNNMTSPSSMSLDEIHRRIRMHDQLGRDFLAGTDNGHADACRYRQPQTIDDERSFKYLFDARPDVFCLDRVGQSFTQEDKFVTRYSRNRIFLSQDIGKSPSDRNEKFVADVMTVVVIN